ncbi:hypothetical protein H6F93_19125 [Leptolyngbya sp. FACHB-671]|uniref:hypothetical protein n=1 Tax=Leptolyngbya sp. FACHB-671 TaxID=2692812 RepID=UPI001689375D|nr:hypothetical protein [Leptolyngbya sp. FACHB-671]MBD1870012.1 hypothetical protein [Cyanobacteria bacterium FACHB-471]MBD2069608.1 hypothetical protein [Leptolyngbya sp. FACHB-671]
MNKKTSNDSSLSVQVIVLSLTAWAIIALLFFLLFSVPLPGQGRPSWYGVTTYVLEDVAFLGAAILCFRNWRSSLIVSGRTVWLAIGLGMLSYFIANLLLAQWELGWGQSPDLSPGDFFFILTYFFLGWGMLLAVISRRLNLALWQWATVLGIAIVGILLAYLLLSAPEETELPAAPTGIEQTAPANPGAPPDAAPALPESSTEADALAANTAPGWVTSLAADLEPLGDIVTLLYIIGDIILVVMATTLLLAFWGGRFSLSWRFIAAAAFSLYLADIWFFYATTYVEDYETGALPEVFFIFSAVLFGIGAALEYDLSTRSRRGGRRRA